MRQRVTQYSAAFGQSLLGTDILTTYVGTGCTLRPMFLAVPSTMRMAASMVVALRSGILISAISCEGEGQHIGAVPSSFKMAQRRRLWAAVSRHRRAVLPRHCHCPLQVVPARGETSNSIQRLENLAVRTFSCSWVTVPTFTLLGSPLPALICASSTSPH